MADDNNDISVDDATASGGKKKLIIIIVVLLLLVGGGVGSYFLFFSASENIENEAISTDDSAEKMGSEQALYVAMPRPFIFNVQDGKRDRLVQIKVQLMVRGEANDILAKKHIPLIEGTLVRVFGTATAGQLRSTVGKEELRALVLESLNEAMMKVEDKNLIEAVLFTGFVLQ